MLDVELELLPEARALADATRVRVHVASAEVLARVRLLEPGPLAPGRGALAQLRLESRVAAGRGDRLVIRSYSPATTIGGARVLDPLPPRRRPKDRAAVERLRAAATPAEAAAALASEAGATGIEAARLAARLTLPLQSLRAALASTPALVALGHEPTVFFARERARGARRRDAAGARGISPRGSAASRDAAPGAARSRVPARARRGARARAGRSLRGGSRPAGAGVGRASGPRGAPEPRGGRGSPGGDGGRSDGRSRRHRARGARRARGSAHRDPRASGAPAGERRCRWRASGSGRSSSAPHSRS